MDSTSTFVHLAGESVSVVLDVSGGVPVIEHWGGRLDSIDDWTSTALAIPHGGLDDAVSLLDVDLSGFGRSLVVGAAMSPGLSGLLARHLASRFDVVDEIHIAIHGTAGPACAREYHRALSGLSPAWR
ncbi:MAG: hypothetical protein ACO3Q0_09440, partial [Ilumatobacteraceae bacterium]